MSEPATEAGRRLLADAEYEDDGEWVVACYAEMLPERILAIEQEARADLAARIVAAVERLDTAWLNSEIGHPRRVRLAAVLDAIRREASDDRA